MMGSGTWDVHFKESHYTKVFPKEDIVYLSSDSSNVLEGKIYV